MTPEIRDLSDLSEPSRLWLARAEDLHRAFRPTIPGDYAEYMALMIAEGAGIVVSTDADAVQAIAVFRRHHTTFGHRFYVDDLVTRENQRSRGHGKALLTWCETQARSHGCDMLDLESGTHRARAHRFYFREGMHIFAFSFRKALRPALTPPSAKTPG